MNETVVTEEGMDMVTMTAAQPQLVHRNGLANGRNGNGHNGAQVSATKRVATLVCDSGAATQAGRLLAEQGFELEYLPVEDLVRDASLSRACDLLVFELSSFEGRWQDACLQLRTRHSRLPIVVLCESCTPAERIRGFENGADEIISRPFTADEVAARLRSLLRRAGDQRVGNGCNGHSALNFRYSDLVLDLASRVCYRGDYRIDLSRREFALLSYFVQNADQVLSRERILHNVWGTGRKHDSNDVDVYVNYLRNKTEQGKHFRLIHTIRRKGYVLSERPES
jgi:two-component system response regulator MprA